MSPRTVDAAPLVAERMRDPEFAEAYHRARRQIAAFDSVVRAIDERRVARGMSKAELARRAGIRPDAVRRLLSMRSPNPTLATVVALADAVDLEVTVTARPAASAGTPRRSA